MVAKDSVTTPANGPKPNMATQKMAMMISWKLRETAMIPRQTRYTGMGAMLRAAPSPLGTEMIMPMTVEVTVMVRLSISPSLMSINRWAANSSNWPVSRILEKGNGGKNPPRNFAPLGSPS